MQDSVYQDTVYYINEDSTNYIRFTINRESTTLDYRRKIIAVMDGVNDTLPLFIVNLPKTIAEWATYGENLFFFYDKKKAIFIHRDPQDKSKDQFLVKQKCDSLDQLSPYFPEYERKILRVIPDNGKYTYKCLTRNNTRIYIYNFKGEEMDNTVKMIKNTFNYVPYDSLGHHKVVE